MARKATAKTNNTPAPEERKDDTETPVTEVAHVDANTTKEDAKEISGADLDGKDSTQQADAFEGVMEAAEQAKHPDKAPKKGEPLHGHHIPPHLRHGPGSDVA